jgi:hypothetical protein
MAVSLAQALQNSGANPTVPGEAQLPDEGLDCDGDDPFCCEGALSNLYDKPLTLGVIGPEESSEELLKHWFGSDMKNEWFLYPDKAVRSPRSAINLSTDAMQLFLTDLLFSSPRLRFSRAPKNSQFDRKMFFKNILLPGISN